MYSDNLNNSIILTLGTCRSGWRAPRRSVKPTAQCSCRGFRKFFYCSYRIAFHPSERASEREGAPAFADIQLRVRMQTKLVR